MLILLDSIRCPVVFILDSGCLALVHSLISGVDILTLLKALNLAHVNFINSLNLVEMINLILITINIAASLILSPLTVKAGISQPLVVSEVDLDDTRRGMERAHDGSIGDPWFEYTSLFVECHKLIDPAELLTALWRQL